MNGAELAEIGRALRAIDVSLMMIWVALVFLCVRPR
jgi:hypothetical protein